MGIETKQIIIKLPKEFRIIEFIIKFLMIMIW